MAHLKKSATGHLLKGAGGHLVNDCTHNDCNTCDPPIPDILFVTLANLGGAFAYANGKRQLDWVSGCIWQYYDALADKSVRLYWDVGPSRWYVMVNGETGWWPLGNCTISFWNLTGQDGCDPVATYTYLGCDDFSCSGSCAASAGATCVVSYV